MFPKFKTACFDEFDATCFQNFLGVVLYFASYFGFF